MEAAPVTNKRVEHVSCNILHGIHIENKISEIGEPEKSKIKMNKIGNGLEKVLALIT